MGMAHLAKAVGFHRGQNWLQTLRYSEIAANKLKQLKDRRLETVKIINDAILLKFDSFQRLGRHREALECIQECYTMWAMNHVRNPGSMTAALALIQSCIQNKEYEDAERYARHAYFMIAEMTDNFIPSDQRSRFLADVSYYLALAIHRWAKSVGIPPEDKQKAGEEAIEHARRALELFNQLHGTESTKAAGAMSGLADALSYFNKDDDEVISLREKAISIMRRQEGNLGVNVCLGENNLGLTYYNRALSAKAVNDEDRELSYLQLALPKYREAARIAMANNHFDMVERVTRHIVQIEERIQQIEIAKTAATTRG